MPNWKMDPGELLKFTFEGSDYMAIPTSIKTLLSGDVVEWARIEFKETWDAAASLKSNDGTDVRSVPFFTWRRKNL